MKCIMIEGKAPRVGKVQEDVNSWLSNNPNVKIVHVAQSMNTARTIVTIYYEN